MRLEFCLRSSSKMKIKIKILFSPSRRTLKNIFLETIGKPIQPLCPVKKRSLSTLWLMAGKIQNRTIWVMLLLRIQGPPWTWYSGGFFRKCAKKWKFKLLCISLNSFLASLRAWFRTKKTKTSTKIVVAPSFHTFLMILWQTPSFPLLKLKRDLP